MDFSGKLIWVLVFAGVMTVWQLLGQPLYESAVVGQGWAMGIGETYLGYMVPGIVTLIVTALLLRRTRKE